MPPPINPTQRQNPPRVQAPAPPASPHAQAPGELRAPPTTTRRFVVCQGGSFTQGIKRFKAGETFEADPNKLSTKDALKHGYIRHETAPEPYSPEPFPQPGRAQMPRLPEVRERAGDHVQVTNTAAGISQGVSKPREDRGPNPQGGPIVQAKTPWTYDPSTLSGKTVEELNVMIHETDDSVVPFETAEEAIAHLSQEFGKK